MSSPALAEPSIGARGRAASLSRDLVWGLGWPFRVALLGLVRLYRVTLSGLFGGQCRFHPSCSEYAEHAIRGRGAAIGGALVAWRILRCNPFGRGGVDPAPRRRGQRAYEAVIHRKHGVPS